MGHTPHKLKVSRPSSRVTRMSAGDCSSATKERGAVLGTRQDVTRTDTAAGRRIRYSPQPPTCSVQ
jgi:hypothetical protein